MLRRPLPFLPAMPPSSGSRSKRHQQQQQQQNPSPISGVICSPCRHSPAATLDFFIFLVVLFSCAFLIASSLAHLFRSLPILLPPLFSALQHSSALPLPALLLLFLLPLLVLAASLAFASRGPTPLLRGRRRCGNPRCRGLREAAEFDVQLQTGDSLRSPPAAATWKEIEELPWKGGQQGNNPDYECLRAELRRMAPPNGRAVLLFRARCGCPVAKLAAWGPKHGRRHKKGVNLALDGEQ